ncbi:hypothetical protein RN001_006489 [Aquatica leii]|uniref:Large ribosomal subunit protein mL64 n=1 Tax=Aquatica leii TaxID=1421715 RepID=A0AAN7SS94_9COLE|nr:hypothetical protein RN001_006489 [Aquatica leii]
MYRSLLNKIRPLHNLGLRNKSEPAINIEQLEQQNASVDVIDDEARIREEEIQRKRNKSRLRVYHRNVVHEEVPYPEPKIWLHGTIKFNRNMYGRYGRKSGFDESLCWPTKQELKDKLEYESVAYPYDILKVAEEARQKRIEEQKIIEERQADVVKKMQKLDRWKEDLRKKIEKKEEAVLVAKEQKDRLVEEVRRHFGYTVDPRDDKFKELLEKKEKEQKKAMKQARKKVKEEKMLAQILGKKPEDTKSRSENVDISTDNKENT